MNPSDSQDFDSYIPVYDIIPEKWEDARVIIVEQLKKISNSVNIREIGWYLDQELLSGKAFIPGISSYGSTSQAFRTVLRKVINFGQLPNASTKSVAHEILVDDNFSLVFMGGYATNPTSLIGITIPYSDTTSLSNQISLTIDTTNVNITTGSDRTFFTRCFVILEYMQEL